MRRKLCQKLYKKLCEGPAVNLVNTHEESIDVILRHKELSGNLKP